MNEELFNMVFRGYFPKELPPAFNSYLFSTNLNEIEKKLQSDWNNKDSSLITCSIPKNGAGRRYVHVLNPMTYYYLSTELVNHFGEIDEICRKSCISKSIPIKSKDVKKRYLIPLSETVASFQEERLTKSFDKNIELKVDIANFYPSIYTHTIPWAFVGKRFAKEIWRNHSERFIPSVKYKFDIGNNIDKRFQKCQDKQTHGIPVGPDASFLIAELILSHIDFNIQRRIPKLSGCRYYDDFFFYCDTREEAESILRALIEELNIFGLEVNLSKVEINQMPVCIYEKFAIKLSQCDLGLHSSINAIKIYFDIMWSLMKECPSQIETICKYGLKVMKNKIYPLSQKDMDIVYMLLFKTAILAPSVTPQVLNLVKDFENEPDKSIVQKMANIIFKKNICLGHHVEVLWAIWVCKIYSIEISSDTVVEVFSMNNALCSIMMLDYLHNTCRTLLNDARVKRSIKKINSSISISSLYDSNWILAYEGSIKGWLKRLDIVKSDSFFSLLYSLKVSFYDDNPMTDYLDVSYIINKKPFPKHIQEQAENEKKRIKQKIKKEEVKVINNIFNKEEKDKIQQKMDVAVEEELFNDIIYHLLNNDYNENDIQDKYLALLKKFLKY